MTARRAGAWSVAIILAAGGCARDPAPDPRFASVTVPSTFAAADSFQRAGQAAGALDTLTTLLEDPAFDAQPAHVRSEILLRIGQVETDRAQLDRALPHLDRAIALALEAGAGHELLLARTRIAWGGAAKNLGRYDDARRSHEAAATIARSLGDAGRVELANSIAGVGLVHRRDPARRDSTALLYARACSILVVAVGDTSLEVARLRMNLAVVLSQLGRTDEARTAIAAARPVIAAHYGPDNSNVSLASSVTGWLAFRDGRLDEARADLESVLESHARQRRNAPPGTPRQRYRPKAADALVGVHLAAGRPEKAWDVLDAAQSFWLAEADTSRSPFDPPYDLAGIQARLAPETALIGWLDISLVDERPIEAWAYVLRDRGPVRWIRLPAPNRAAPDTFELFVQHLETTLRWPTRVQPTPATDRLAHTLWRQRFAPLEPALVGVRRLVVALSTHAARAPLDAFIDDRGRVLAERFSTRYVHSPSATALLAHRERGRLEEDAPVALFIDGDVVGGDGKKRWRLGEVGRLERTTWVHAGRRAESEVRAAWTGRAPRLVRFDGHAVFNTRIPGGVALVLDGRGAGARALAAPAGTMVAFVDAPDDGLLTTFEIERMDLPADLVVLAACQSAGRFDYGGFVGVGDALLRAGARNVLTTVWPVDERATVALLERFFARAYAADGSPLRPLEDALKEARLELRNQVDRDGTRPFAHPAYWAPLVLVGEGGRAISAGRTPASPSTSRRP